MCIVTFVMTGPVSSKSGRPRSSELNEAVHEAALDLIGAGFALSSLTLVAITRHAGVSRNSMYRRWRTKEDLYRDVLVTKHPALPVLNAQSSRENLVTLMNALRARGTDPRVRQFVRAIDAEAAQFPEVRELLVDAYVNPALEAMRTTIRRGKETGEIRVDVDEDVLTRLLSGDFDPIDGSQHVVDLVFEGAAPR